MAKTMFFSTVITMTGTRHAHKLTTQQKHNFAIYLKILLHHGYTHLQHGDALGADAFAHQEATMLGFQVIIHPPTDPKFRAFCQSEDIRIPNAYKIRNQSMVESCSLVLALPANNTERLRSGTWMTVRMARKQGLPIVIFYPDGRVSDSNNCV